MAQQVQLGDWLTGPWHLSTVLVARCCPIYNTSDDLVIYWISNQILIEIKHILTYSADKYGERYSHDGIILCLSILISEKNNGSIYNLR